MAETLRGLPIGNTTLHIIRYHPEAVLSDHKDFFVRAESDRLTHGELHPSALSNEAGKPKHTHEKVREVKLVSLIEMSTHAKRDHADLLEEAIRTGLPIGLLHVLEHNKDTEKIDFSRFAGKTAHIHTYDRPFVDLETSIGESKPHVTKLWIPAPARRRF